LVTHYTGAVKSKEDMMFKKNKAVKADSNNGTFTATYTKLIKAAPSLFPVK
jgi:hypothetical protein